ncbi:Glutaminyl-peptide cyclotransferase-like protein [Quillaja saponaria]|uniref:Glutaminyl-peptide cyclotransferase-like protein n=1 Tax=Quillaja saponaria TaxID=32244 RepID=A0AAD7Q3G3_QUISA|nr:Glutaminyl-peptide cyclotransferase-like protein [Quillaja saponaria]
MAGGSLKKKYNKRQNFKPYDSMASSRRTTNNYSAISVIVPVSLIICVIGLMGISSIKWRSFKSRGPYEVVNVFPHDPNAFTQGLLYAGNDTLFESTGLHGKSSIRKVALRTGKVEALQKMDDSYFGEGLTLLGERLFQLTWLQTTGFMYDWNNLSKFEKFIHQMKDGWGLATDGKVLFGSDGSSTLYRLDPQTFKVLSIQVVKYKGHQVHNLNELEFINDEVWANVWQTDCIARISPKDGGVLGWLLLPKLREELLAAGYNGIDVLNGIAWDSEQKRIFVTGKLWPKLYEIKVFPAKKQYNDRVIEQLCLHEPFNFGQP